MKKKSIADVVQEQDVQPEVSHNPSALLFPTDIWGFTSDLKQAGKLCISKTHGAEDKYKMVRNVLLILLAHLDARYNEESNRAKSGKA